MESNNKWGRTIFIYFMIALVAIIINIVAWIFISRFNDSTSTNDFYQFLTDIITVTSVLVGFLGVFFSVIIGISTDSKIGKVIRISKFIRKQLMISMVIPFITGLISLIVFPFFKIYKNFGIKSSIIIVLILYSIFLLSFVVLGWVVMRIFYYDTPEKEKEKFEVPDDRF